MNSETKGIQYKDSGFRAIPVTSKVCISCNSNFVCFGKETTCHICKHKFMLVKADFKGHPIKLSKRELQIWDLIRRGNSNKDAAYECGITEGTIKVYLSKIYRKVGVKDRLQLALSKFDEKGYLQS